VVGGRAMGQFTDLLRCGRFTAADLLRCRMRVYVSICTLMAMHTGVCLRSSSTLTPNAAANNSGANTIRDFARLPT
jgi:hypothetical protein